MPVAADWDGDGISGIGIYTVATGTWATRNTPSGGPPENTYSFPGTPGYYPVTDDWDANGTDTLGGKHMASPVWILRFSNTSGPPSGTDLNIQFGQADDLPVVWSVPAFPTVTTPL